MPDGSIGRLLAAVWGTRKGYVFLPFKDLNKKWNETKGIPYDGMHLPSLEDLPRGDVYFCPVVFTEPRRKKDCAGRTNLLWSDLDFANPNECRLRPSIAWESSPGRFQALWFLSTEVSAEEASNLSKRIAYAEGADKGGWDVTQVLRLPGTRNYKYDNTPEVRLLWAKRSAYSVSEVMAAYPAVNGEAKQTAEYRDWPEVDEQTIQTAIAALPIGYRRRLTTKIPGADRSLELQKLTRDLVKRRTDPDVVLHLIQRSVWNKFAGRSDEQLQLLKQLDSAVGAVEQQQESEQPVKLTRPEPIAEMEVHKWNSFLSIPTHLRWLIDDMWVDQTVGFISGHPKSYKTWIAEDLALSIVSGTSFLGRYPVRHPGPVILIQEEDPTSVLQDRMRLIAKSKGMLPSASFDVASKRLHMEFPEYPLYVINLQGFNLGVEEKVDQVRHLIAKINPVMVILDPLIVMLPEGRDEFKATEVASVLQSVKMWREEFGCSVVIVHHWNKAKKEDGDRSGSHMYGTFAFHAWLESALHVDAVIEEGQDHIDTIVMEREFKAAPSSKSLTIQFLIDSVKEYSYAVKFNDKDHISTRQQNILDLMATQGGGLSTSELMMSTGIPRTKLLDEMRGLLRMHAVVASKGGGRGKQTKYYLPDQVPDQTEASD